jgi:hypothetical protein
MPWTTDYGLSPELTELLASFERGDDWTGTLTGIAFQEVQADEWLLCWAIDESYPEGCGSGVVLNAAPPEYFASPERFETQTGDGSDQPAVIISRSMISVHGTFFADAALFVISEPEQTVSADDSHHSPQPAGETPSEWEVVGAPASLNVTEIGEAVEAMTIANVSVSAGPGRVPVLLPPIQMSSIAESFLASASNPAENLAGTTYVLDAGQSEEVSVVSYISLQSSLATEDTKAAIAHNATVSVRAVVSDDARPDCAPFEEGGRNDAILSWIDGDLVLEIHVQPLPECESSALTVDDVIAWANNEVAWCGVVANEAVDCIRPPSIAG